MLGVPLTFSTHVVLIRVPYYRLLPEVHLFRKVPAFLVGQVLQ